MKLISIRWMLAVSVFSGLAALGASVCLKSSLVHQPSLAMSELLLLTTAAGLTAGSVLRLPQTWRR